jgi:hypothetical protein
MENRRSQQDGTMKSGKGTIVETNSVLPMSKEQIERIQKLLEDSRTNRSENPLPEIPEAKVNMGKKRVS